MTPRSRLALQVTLLGALLGGACDEPARNDPPAAASAAKATGTASGPVARGRDLPLLNVTFGLEAWKQLIAQIRTARTLGVIAHGDAPWVPLVLMHGNERFDATARLAGDRLEHLNLEHPSLRIQLDASDRLLGLRSFRLQTLDTRSYHAELLYFEALRPLGVLTPRYRFVHVGFGRQHPTVMVMEEALGKDLLESQQRRPGVIVRFDDDAPAGAEAAATRPPIVAFERGRVDASERLRGERALAVGLLRGFVEGKLSAAQAFDVERLSSFLAVSELWDAAGALHWSNLRFAYDAFTGRLEPVAYDAGVMAATPRGPAALNLANGTSQLDRALRAGWLADARVRARTLERLHGLAVRVLEGALLRELQEREAALLAELPAGVFDARRVDWKRFVARAAELAQLDAGSLAPTPATAPAQHGTPGEPPLASPAPADELPARTRPVLPELPAAALAKLRWLQIDPAARRVSVAAGVYTVRTTLWLPDGYTLVLAPGVTLRFARDAALVVRGGCEVQGTQALPVRLEPSGADWPGLVVLGGGNRCDVQGLLVRGTRGVQTAELKLSGGATFYDTGLSLRDVHFEASTAPDALHLVRSRVALERVRVSAARTDGVDVDHTTGSLRELACEAIGGDCLDTRSSQLEVDGLRVHQAGDKALSAGRGSALGVRKLQVHDTGLGVAVKDGARLTLTGASFERVTGAALLAVQERPGYGPAQLEASGVRFDAVGARHLLQPDQRIVLEGRELPVEPASNEAER